MDPRTGSVLLCSPENDAGGLRREGKVKRTSVLRRKAPIKRSQVVKRSRPASETRRIYGSKPRIEWVHSLPCSWCGGEENIENAHTVTGGMGRKADASTIAPLCHAHHVAFDQHVAPFDNEENRELMKTVAARVERKWLDMSNATLDMPRSHTLGDGNPRHSVGNGKREKVSTQ